jgi:hypothetical protein
MPERVIEGKGSDGPPGPYMGFRPEIFQEQGENALLLHPAGGDRDAHRGQHPEPAVAGRPSHVIVILGQQQGFIEPPDGLVEGAADQNAEPRRAGGDPLQRQQISVGHLVEHPIRRPGAQGLHQACGHIQTPRLDLPHRLLQEIRTGDHIRVQEDQPGPPGGPRPRVPADGRAPTGDHRTTRAPQARAISGVPSSDPASATITSSGGCV